MGMAARLKAARKAANMTQNELAEKLGVSYVVISQYENGVRNPKIETVKKLAVALNCSADKLLGLITVDFSVLYETRNRIKDRIDQMSDKEISALAVILGIDKNEEDD